MDTKIETETLEEIQQRHRIERKALQAKIQQLKKAAGKPDKKKKKELDQQIAQLEADLKNAQLKETAVVENGIEDENEPEPEPVETKEEIKPGGRVSKAQKRRDKKAALEAQRSRLAEQDTDDDGVERAVESLAIGKALRSRGLRLAAVAPDGDCLYSAVKHQLQSTGRSSSVKALRNLTADYIRKHKNDFTPFMCDPNTGDMLDDPQFERYCKDVASTNTWGGQIELQALASALKTTIRVIQADPPGLIVQGEEYAKNGEPLVLTYHRHLYGLGEHYNSTKVSLDAESSEDECE